MPILTLTTDWGRRDHYLASFKGELLSLIPEIQMIDISHEVEKFNTMNAAFIIQNSFHKFPKGTIHFIGVSSIENFTSDNPFVIVYTKGHYLIGEDNGIFMLILGQNEKEIIRLPISANTNRVDLNNFFLDLIKKLSSGNDFRSLGTPSKELVESYFAHPTVDSQTIRGSVIFIDSYGNAVINVTRELFLKEQKERDFIIHLRNSSYTIRNISPTYGSAVQGELVALFNQDDFLEISLNKESAGKLLGLKLMDAIRIEFNDTKAG